MAKSYKCLHKVGPGGIRCSCCNPIGHNGDGNSMKDTKRYLNRYDRRTTKLNIKAESED